MDDIIRRPLAEKLFGRPDPKKPYCAFNCDNPSHEWEDELSKKEYGISGLCQNCQNAMFGPPDDAA